MKIKQYKEYVFFALLLMDIAYKRLSLFLSCYLSKQTCVSIWLQTN